MKTRKNVNKNWEVKKLWSCKQEYINKAGAYNSVNKKYKQSLKIWISKSKQET